MFNHKAIPAKSKPTASLSNSAIPFTTLIMTPCLEISPLIIIASFAFSSSVKVWGSAAEDASSAGLILITSNKYLYVPLTSSLTYVTLFSASLVAVYLGPAYPPSETGFNSSPLSSMYLSLRMSLTISSNKCNSIAILSIPKLLASTYKIPPT